MKRLTSICLVLVMLMALVACGSNNTSNNTSNETPDTSASDSKTPDTSTSDNKTSDAPSRTVLRYPLSAIGNSMDPHPAQQAVDLTVMDPIYEGMFKLRDDGSLDPRLALSYEVSDDGLTYTYKLRPGVKFHNGDPVTVEDIEFSFQRCIDNKWRTSWLANLVKVEGVSDDTVVFTLSAPNAVFGTSMNMVPVLCKKVVENMGTDFSVKASAAGTGPYRFESYDPKAKIVLKANEDYYLEQPSIETIEFVIITDNAARLMALESGDIDFNGISASDIPVVQANKDLVFESVIARATRLAVINTGNKNSPLYDKRVRQAIAYCVNKEDIVLIAENGIASATDTLVPPTITDAPKSEEMPLRYTRDIDKAKALLKEAGYENGFEMVISSYTGAAAKAAEVLVENLAEIGIKATILTGDNASIQADCQNNPETTYDMLILGWSFGVSYNEYTNWYREDVSHMPQAARSKDFNWDFYESMKAEALSATSFEERKTGYAKIDEYLTDFCSVIPLYNTMNNQAWNKDLNAVPYSLRPYIYDWSWK